MENKEKETPEETLIRVTELMKCSNVVQSTKKHLHDFAIIYHSERLKIEAPLLPNEYKRGFKDGEISKDQEIERLKEEVKALKEIIKDYC